VTEPLWADGIWEQCREGQATGVQIWVLPGSPPPPCSLGSAQNSSSLLCLCGRGGGGVNLVFVLSISKIHKERLPNNLVGETEGQKARHQRTGCATHWDAPQDWEDECGYPQRAPMPLLTAAKETACAQRKTLLGCQEKFSE
jgi:hypothetical protein